MSDLSDSQQASKPNHLLATDALTLLSPVVAKFDHSPPPILPATFWDIVIFLCAGGLALIFTALFVLFVEDDPNDSKNHGEQQEQEQWASYQHRAVA